MKEEIEEVGKSNERTRKGSKSDYIATEPAFEIVVDGKTIRGFRFRSEAVAWAVHHGPTFAYYHSGLWEVLGLDEEGFEYVKSHVGNALEKQVREIAQKKFPLQV